MTNRPHSEAGEQSDSAAVTTIRDQGESASRSVIEAVAAATGADPTTMPPLYDAIDPDALDSALDSLSRGTRQSREGSISFRFNGCCVTVHADGRTVVSPPESSL